MKSARRIDFTKVTEDYENSPKRVRLVHTGDEFEGAVFSEIGANDASASKGIESEQSDLIPFEIAQKDFQSNMRSPIKVYFPRGHINLQVPENTELNGITPKHNFSHGMVKKGDCDIVEEVMGAKETNYLLSWISGNKGLAPENGVVVGQEAPMIYSKYLSSFKTLYSMLKEKSAQDSMLKFSNNKLKCSLSESLWVEFLKYQFLGFVVYRNGDMHNRNIGLVQTDQETHIAAVDFGRIFYVEVSDSPQRELNAFLHLLYFWHHVKKLSGEDIAILSSCATDFYSSKSAHIEDLEKVICRMEHVTKKLKRIDVEVKSSNDIESTIPFKVLVRYSETNAKHRNPLVQIRPLSPAQLECAKSFKNYSQAVSNMFNSGLNMLPGISGLLDANKENGIDIKEYLDKQNININYYDDKVKEHKLAAMPATTLISPSLYENKEMERRQVTLSATPVI